MRRLILTLETLSSWFQEYILILMCWNLVFYFKNMEKDLSLINNKYSLLLDLINLNLCNPLHI